MSTYKRQDKKFKAKLSAIEDRKQEQSRAEERVYKSLWHGLIALVGLYELSTHRTRLGKALAIGLTAFHIDACIADALDVPTTPQKLLRRLRP